MASRVPAARPHRPDDWQRSLATQYRVLSALVYREAETRRGRRFFMGFLASGIEPLIVVGTISIVFTVINRPAPYGNSLVLFIATGVFPIYLFIHTSMKLRAALAPGSHRKRYPIETAYDHIAAHSLLHILSTGLVTVCFFAGLYLWGIRQAMPWDPETALKAIFTVFMFGVGAGIINSVIARLFPFWDVMWPGVARGALHFSGPYFVAAYLAPDIRWYFALNPVIHVVDWFRGAFYFFYPKSLTNIWYPIFFALGMIALGLLLEAGTRSYLEDKE